MWMKERLSSRGAVHLHVVVLLSHVSGIIYTYIYEKLLSYTIAPKGGYYAISPHNITPESNFKVRRIKKMITLQCSSRLPNDFSSSAT